MHFPVFFMATRRHRQKGLERRGLGSASAEEGCMFVGCCTLGGSETWEGLEAWDGSKLWLKRRVGCQEGSRSLCNDGINSLDCAKLEVLVVSCTLPWPLETDVFVHCHPFLRANYIPGALAWAQHVYTNNICT